jgi:hypothetical protein
VRGRISIVLLVLETFAGPGLGQTDLVAVASRISADECGQAASSNTIRDLLRR